LSYFKVGGCTPLQVTEDNPISIQMLVVVGI